MKAVISRGQSQAAASMARDKRSWTGWDGEVLVSLQGRRQSHKVKSRTMRLDGCSCCVRASLDLLHHGTSGPERCQQTPTKLHSTRAQQLTHSCAFSGRLTRTNQCRTGGIHTPFAGSVVLLGNSSPGPRPEAGAPAFSSPELHRAHSPRCLVRKGRDLMVLRVGSLRVLLHPKRSPPLARSPARAEPLDCRKRRATGTLVPA